MGSQESMNVTIWIIIVFQERALQGLQILIIDSFCRMHGASAQCLFGAENYLDAGILLNYDDNDYSQRYRQIKEAFRALWKDDILQPYISNDNYRSSNVRAHDVGYNLYVFGMKYQQKIPASQSIEVECELDGVVPNVVNGYALVLTTKLFSVSSDGQRHCDLIQV